MDLFKINFKKSIELKAEDLEIQTAETGFL